MNMVTINIYIPSLYPIGQYHLSSLSVMITGQLRFIVWSCCDIETCATTVQLTTNTAIIVFQEIAIIYTTGNCLNVQQ